MTISAIWNLVRVRLWGSQFEIFGSGVGGERGLNLLWLCVF